MAHPNIHFHFGRLLGSLLGKRVHVTPGARFDPGPTKPAIVATYVDSDGRLTAIVLLSIRTAAYLGAALSMMPAQVANEEASSGKLSESMLENLREVANVCAQIVTDIHGSRLQLHEVKPLASAQPAEFDAFLKTPKRRFDMTIEIGEYGKGDVSIRPS